MATIKVKFRSSSVKMREGTLYFQIVHRRVVRQINAGFRLHASEWDSAGEKTSTTDLTDESRRKYLNEVDVGLRNAFAILTSIVSNYEKSGRSFTSDDIVSAYLNRLKNGGFMSFAVTYAGHLAKSGRFSAARKIRTTLNSFSRFMDRDDIAFELIDSTLLEEYEGWLKMNGVSMNTSSFYMRTLRAVYNAAVERDLTGQRQPFRHVYTGMCKTVKRALSLRFINRIRNLELTSRPGLDFARNIFLLSFCMRGMSFVDICFLKKKDLASGILSYRRQKTGQLLQVKWERPMQRLLDKLGKSNTEYLLPIITDTSGHKSRQYETALHRVNRNLKEVGRLVGLETALTTYVARHSWASLAKSQNIPVSIISEGLGHDSVSTTKIYLASLDTSVVDRANSKILRLLEQNDC